MKSDWRRQFTSTASSAIETVTSREIAQRMDRDGARASVDVTADPFFAPVPNGQAGRNDDYDEQANPDKRQMSAGAKASPWEAVGFYHAATLAIDA